MLCSFNNSAIIKHIYNTSKCRNFAFFTTVKVNSIFSDHNLFKFILLHLKMENS